MKKIKYYIKFMDKVFYKYITAVFFIGLASLFYTLIPLVIRMCVDKVIKDKIYPSEYIIYFASLAVFLTALYGIFTALGKRFAATSSETGAKNMRDRLYSHIQNMPYSFHSKADTGDLMQRCTSDIKTIRHFVSSQLIEVGRCIFLFVFTLAAMLLMSPQMTVISLACVPFIFVSTIIFYKKVTKIFKVTDESEAKLSSVLQENITGIRVVKAFARAEYETARFEKRNTEYKNNCIKLIRILSIFWASSDLICGAQIGAGLTAGTIMVAKGNMSIGSMMAFITYLGYLLWPIRSMGRILADMGKSSVAIGRIKEILDKPEEKDAGDRLEKKINGAIEFKNISFGYEPGNSILKNINIRIKPGMTVAVTGPTGCGKTTLVQLLTRLYEPDEGSILIDGINIKNIKLSHLRKNVGIVLQEPFLYSRSIRDNIAISKLDADDEQVYSAASTAHIHNVITNFEKGYETMVGEKGVTLSGGQKQRAAIARLLMNKCPVLIFDDSLSAVDASTDFAIRKKLKDKLKKTTTIIVSHRVSTMCTADVILVMENGRITALGTHKQLIRKDGYYKTLCIMQDAV